MLGTAGWLALLHFLFHAPPEIVSLWGATVGLVLCLWTGFMVCLLQGDNVSDGSGYGALAGFVASVGLAYLIHYRSYPLLALFADWSWWKLIALGVATGLFTGLCLGILLGRLRPRGSVEPM